MRVGAWATARKGMAVQAHQSLGELLELQLELAGLLHVAHQQLTPHVPLLHEYCALRVYILGDSSSAERSVFAAAGPVGTAALTHAHDS